MYPNPDELVGPYSDATESPYGADGACGDMCEMEHCDPDFADHFLSGSLSHGESDDGDYTESDSEGEESYKAGGYHPVQIGEVYKNRYKVVSKLGWGHFSTVWLAEDLEGSRSTGRACYVALKVQKSASHYTEAAYDEIELLSKARNSRNAPAWKNARGYYSSRQLCPGPQSDPEYTGVVSLCDYFETTGPNGVHVCMVFETMGPNVLTLIKKFDFKGVPLDIVKKLTTDCLVGLDYLHRICGIIHTDIKPENVLVTCPLGVPVGKTGDPLIPLDRPIDSKGLHFSDLPAARRSKPIPPTPPDLSSSDSAAVPTNQPSKLSKSQKKRLQRKKKQQSAKASASPVSVASEANSSRPMPDKKKKKKKKKTTSHTTPTNTGETVWTDPPFVKNQLKPSRSDPSLLSHYPQASGSARAPYNHPKSLFARARNLVQKKSVAVSAGSLSTNTSSPTLMPACQVLSPESIAQIDIFNNPSTHFKIADLGNACWTDKHFSEDIQTRQYRSPEVLIGAGYDTSADIWSLACMVFELVTGDYLFDPKGSDEYPRDEDHLALIIELLGPLPKDLLVTGKRTATYFNRKGDLRHIKQLRYWGLREVLEQKYRVPEPEASELAEFLLPMLHTDPALRATAQKLLSHPWLKRGPPLPAPTVAAVDEQESVDDPAPDIILHSPGFSSARSEAL